MRKLILLFACCTFALRAESWDSTRSSQATLEGFALGLYTGFESGAGNVLPYEPAAKEVGVPKLFLAGIAIKYRYGLFMIRAAAEGGFPFSGKGNDDAGIASEEYKMTLIHAPASLGMSFPLFDKNCVYILAGYSYLTGTFQVKGDDASNTYNFKVNGIHFIVGTEIAVGDSAVFTFEWVHTSGISGALKNSSVGEREIGFANDQLLLGYSYYFQF